MEKALCVSRLPPEPETDDPTVTHVMLRLPSGHRLERRFRNQDKLQVCAYVYVLGVCVCAYVHICVSAGGVCCFLSYPVVCV